MTPITDGSWVHDVCKPGEGATTCRYLVLAMIAGASFACGKTDEGRQLPWLRGE